MHALATILLALAGLCLTPAIAAAQPPALQVRLVDQFGTGVAGVTITLRDAGNTRDLATEVTNRQGQATFATLPLTTVRLTLHGTTASGAAIALGESSFLDAPAILVRTDIGGPLVALVMDDNGLVYLDPATLEPEGGPIATPDDGVALPAQAASLPTTAPAQNVPGQPAPAAASPTAYMLPGWAIILLGLALSAVVLLFAFDWRARP